MPLTRRAPARRVGCRTLLPVPEGKGDRARRYWPALAAAVCLCALSTGCGTTRSSDTLRTATEQILLSNAIDQAVNNIDFQPLAGKDVFLDTERLKGVTDENYLISSLRQHMFAQGCVLKADKASAQYVVEARAGALGTNSHSILIGIPAVNLPGAGAAYPGMPSSIPEIPLAKTTKQAGVAKIALFAYNRETGHPVWQSGAFPVTADAKNAWFLGLGPFQRGSIYDGKTKFAGSDTQFLPFRTKDVSSTPARPSVPVTAEATFDEPPEELARKPAAETGAGVNKTSSTEPSGSGQGTSGPVSSGVVPAGHIKRLPATEKAAQDAAGLAPPPAPTSDPPPSAAIAPPSAVPAPLAPATTQSGLPSAGPMSGPATLPAAVLNGGRMDFLHPGRWMHGNEIAPP